LSVFLEQWLSDEVASEATSSLSVCFSPFDRVTPIQIL
jgi:hypothetical protein